MHAAPPSRDSSLFPEVGGGLFSRWPCCRKRGSLQSGTNSPRGLRALETAALSLQGPAQLAATSVSLVLEAALCGGGLPLPSCSSTKDEVDSIPHSLRIPCLGENLPKVCFGVPAGFCLLRSDICFPETSPRPCGREAFGI